MSSRRPLPTCLTPADLVAELRAAEILEEEVLTHLAVEANEVQELRTWVAELVERGLLTGYQAEEVLAGQGRSLCLGRYRILDRLGSGGMGRVYKAEHIVMRRLVALKILEGGEKGLFEQEVRAAGHLTHPHMVTAFDAAEAEGVAFLVMEYVDGIDLERLIRSDGPRAPRVAAEYVRQTALALQYAYERGLLHCDVKPANLLLTTDGVPSPGQIKVLDLGLARQTVATADSVADGLAGTPDYLAPEAAYPGAPRDVRSDLYSLGCTFYYLLTGEVPFPGGNWTEKLLHHQLDPPPCIRQRVPGIDNALADILDRLLAKNPAERFATPGDVAEALRRFLHPTEDRSSRRVMWWPTWRSAGIAVLVGLTAALGARHSNYLATANTLAHAPTEEVPAPSHVVLTRTGEQFATLASALVAAKDGDTLQLHLSGPVPLEPLNLQGKALTLQAAPDRKPILQGKPTGAWQPLVTSDRQLRLEGLTISSESEAPLLYVENGSLSLSECRLEAPRSRVAIVGRNLTRLELRNCRVVSQARALGIEVGVQECDVRLSGSQLRVSEAKAAALSVWRSDETATNRLRILLEGTEVHAGRILALQGTGEGLEVSACGNRFTYSDAFLSVTGGHPRWRWTGSENTWSEGVEWILSDGHPMTEPGERAALAP